ncbi:MAG: phosphodiesterase [Candidatus Viridilinea halotolerans]|uniref:Phosphodiesterase n=1 Tax=Candidatus Viridilinea halotolerans TaxID=2491704 RepID=A0A426TZC5_9CHLR|nr:MAG: phosphodiesterase [Candidatus Viridilinea halotolerans]
MLNVASLAATAAARFGPGFVRPIYTDYGFANLPATIERIMSGQGRGGLPEAALGDLGAHHETVVLVFVDALGWRFFEPYAAEHPFLQRFVQQGVVSRLTTMFPSTTAAHVTLMHTGLTPGASGVFEWFFYEPQCNRVIAPLLFSFAGDKQRETLAEAGVAPASIFPTTTFYQRLASHGIASTIYQHTSYAHSSFSTTVCAGAKLIPFRTLSEALTILHLRLKKKRGPHYHMLYIDTADMLAHSYSPEAPHVAAEIDTILTTLERWLHPALSSLGRRVLLMLIADHGQIAVQPSKTLLLNRLVPSLVAATPLGSDGLPIAPSGSNRDLFLYINEDRRSGIIEALRTALAGQAEVYPTEELINAGFFGPSSSPRFLSRVGNIVVLPHPNVSVWWEDKRFPLKFKGAHGGLSEAEALTQVAILGY